MIKSTNIIYISSKKYVALSNEFLSVDIKKKTTWKLSESLIAASPHFDLITDTRLEERNLILQHYKCAL
jgi:hypothetical protein